MTAKERRTIEAMYRSLESLPGNILRDLSLDGDDREAMSRGAERARVLVYTWLKDAGMFIRTSHGE